MPSLYDRFINNTGRTIHKLDHYFPIYERHFSKFVGSAATMIEIGVGLGGSLAMWRDYLGPQSRIIGLDIRHECVGYEQEGIHVRIGHQADEAFLQSVIAEFGVPQIILDDGSHIGDEQVTSFRFLYPKMDVQGVYMVEDLHTNYMKEFCGSLRQPDTFIEFCKPKIDEINGHYSDVLTEFTDSTVCMAVYDSVIVLERGRLGFPRQWHRVPEPERKEASVWPIDRKPIRRREP